MADNFSGERLENARILMRKKSRNSRRGPSLIQPGIIVGAVIMGSLMIVSTGVGSFIWCSFPWIRLIQDRFPIVSGLPFRHLFQATTPSLNLAMRVGFAVLFFSFSIKFKTDDWKRYIISDIRFEELRQTAIIWRQIQAIKLYGAGHGKSKSEKLGVTNLQFPAGLRKI